MLCSTYSLVTSHDGTALLTFGPVLSSTMHLVEFSWLLIPIRLSTHDIGVLLTFGFRPFTDSHGVNGLLAFGSRPFGDSHDIRVLLAFEPQLFIDAARR